MKAIWDAAKEIGWVGVVGTFVVVVGLALSLGLSRASISS